MSEALLLFTCFNLLVIGATAHIRISILRKRVERLERERL